MVEKRSPNSTFKDVGGRTIGYLYVLFVVTPHQLKVRVCVAIRMQFFTVA